MPSVRILSTLPLLAALTLGGCGQRVSDPARAVDEYVAAVESGNWSAAYRALATEARGGMTLEEYEAYAVENRDALVVQARALRDALADAEPVVRADVPMDTARVVELEHERGRWFVSDEVPLLRGGDTPEESMLALAAILESNAIEDLLAIMSDDMRERYLAEIDALVSALLDGQEGSVSTYGTSASIDIGDITIRLVREAGAWRIDSVEQPYVYDDYYYDY